MVQTPEDENAFMDALLNGLTSDNFSERGSSPVKPASSRTSPSKLPRARPSSSTSQARSSLQPLKSNVSPTRRQPHILSKALLSRSRHMDKENIPPRAYSNPQFTSRIKRDYSIKTESKPVLGLTRAPNCENTPIASDKSTPKRHLKFIKVEAEEDDTRKPLVARIPSVTKLEPSPKRVKDRKTSPLRVKSENRSPSKKTDLFHLLDGHEDWNFDDSDLLNDEASDCVATKELPLYRQYLRAEVIQVDMSEYVAERNRVEKRIIVRMIFDDRLISNNSSRHEQTREKVPSHTRTIVLLDDWVVTRISVGSEINLVSLPGSNEAFPTEGDIILSCSRPAQILVLHPNVLVTATAVAASPSCNRRSVLQQRLKSSRGNLGDAVVSGNIIHEVFQSTLVRALQDSDPSVKAEEASPHPTVGPLAWSMSELYVTARKVCKTRINDLFMMGMSVDEGVAMVSDKLQNLPAWFERYIAKPNAKGNVEIQDQAILTDSRSSSRDKRSQPRIGITGVYDIEEEIWSPKYGLKGMPDACVRSVISDRPGIQQISKLPGMGDINPFEIKTGRSVASIEHRAQTMLYTLLMSDRYNVQIPGGLLYYTHTNEIIYIEAKQQEVRQLIMSRNEIADYLHGRHHTKVNMTKDIEEIGGANFFNIHATEVSGLPDVIDDPRLCGRCYAQDGCMLYRKANVKSEAIPKQAGLAELAVTFEAKTEHMTSAHTSFFSHWERLISLEETESSQFRQEIWNMNATERQTTGRAFANLELDPTFNREEFSSDVKSRIHRYTYRLRLMSTESLIDSKEVTPRSMLSGHIVLNDPIVVSIDGVKLALSRGFVMELTPHHVVIGVDHRLTSQDNMGFIEYQQAEDKIAYRLDKDEMAGGMGRLRDNVAQLFYLDGQVRTRELIVDLQPPRFQPIEDVAVDLPADLNDDQRNALTKVLSAQDYALVLGMPGTGKTTTIVELIKTLTGQGKSILLTSYTHSAVDTILEKLVPCNIEMLRLGNRDKVRPNILKYTLDETNVPESVQELADRLQSPQIVATTSLSIDHPLFTRRRFDYCIVDEASQITLPTCLGPLRHADIFVLVGDHNQLPPLVRNTTARWEGLEDSLFKRLCEAHPEAVANLTKQYRMNADIMELSSRLVYNGKLQCGSVEISQRELILPRQLNWSELYKPQTEGRESWLGKVMEPTARVVFLDTDLLPARESRIGNLIQNEAEAKLVYQIIGALLASDVASSSINVLTPYRQQIKLLNYLCASLDLRGGEPVPIMTADRSQGRDADVVILSLVRSNEDGQVGELLRDWRRVNVCMTRAKKKLIMIGSPRTLASAEGMMVNLIKTVQERKWMMQIPTKDGDAHPAFLCPSPKIYADA